MKTRPDPTTHNPQELLEELRILVAEGEKILGESAVSHTEGRLESLRERAEAVQEQIGNFYENSKRRVIEGAKKTDTTIRTHPYESLAVAAAIGVLAGFFIGRRTT